MGPLLVEAFRYNRWANLHLLGIYADLPHDQILLTVPGTYGSIAETLLHVVRAEQGYIRRLTGVEPTLNREFPGIGPLQSAAEASGDDLIDIAQRAQPEDQIGPNGLREYSKLSAGIVLLQALHHGNDHRTQICTILGANGVSVEDMDMWSYGRTTGDVQGGGDR